MSVEASPSARPADPAPAHRGRDEPPRRIVIQAAAPAVDDGRYPVKRCVGDVVEVSADVFRDGHEILRAVVRHRAPDGTTGESPLHRVDAHLGGVRWAGRFTVDRPGRWEYTIEAWTDQFGTWRDELARKVAGDQTDLSGELSEGVVLLRAAAEHAGSRGAAEQIERAARQIEDPDLPAHAKHEIALRDELAEVVEPDPIATAASASTGRWWSRSTGCAPASGRGTSCSRARGAACAPSRPRSRGWSSSASTSSTCPRSIRSGSPTARAGTTRRRRRRATRSPYAIGDSSGGHDAIHADLGTDDDLRSLTATAAAHDIDVALDLAIQAPPTTRG